VAARELNALREAWLNPPEWVRTELLEFPGSASGPWKRFVTDIDENGIGTVRYPRIVPKDEDYEKKLKSAHSPTSTMSVPPGSTSHTSGWTRPSSPPMAGTRR